MILSGGTSQLRNMAELFSQATGVRRSSPTNHG